MAHVVFICTANICRSPVAAGMLLDLFQRIGMTDWQVSSAGTWGVVERGAAQNSIQVMADQNIDISDHRARMVSREIIEEADLVLCMEAGHKEALSIEFADQADKIYLLSEMAGRSHSIDDPYGGPKSEFEDMAAELAELIDAGFSQIVRLARENAQERTTSP